MALTQISTAGVKDDLVTSAKIADDAVTSALISDDSISGALLTNNLDIPDNNKIRFGTGNDLEIYHTGGENFIRGSASASRLYIDSCEEVQIRHLDTDGSNIENMIKAKGDGAVELYHDNTKKFETTSYGSASAGQLRVTSSNATTVGFSCGDAGTGFYNSGSNAIGYSANGTQKWNINSSGDLRLVDSVKATFGTGDDLKIYYDGSNSYFDQTDNTGNLNFRTNSKILFKNADSSETIAKFIADGAVELYYDNTLKLTTLSSGVQMANGSGNNTLSLFDSDKISFGNDGDLKIFHDGAHTYFDNYTGNVIFRKDNTETFIKMIEDGGVELYNDGTKKFNTYSGGTYTYGECNISAAEGVSAELYLIADEGDDNGDIWRIISNHDINDLTFSNNTSGSFVNKLTLTKEGNLYGTYAEFAVAGSALYVNCNTTGDVDGAVFRHARGGLSGYAGKMMTFKGNDGTDEGSIVIGTTTTTYNTSSDYRLKENEVTISDGITRLKQLKPYQFNFKREPGVKVDGFFAHEVDAIIPYSVSGEKDALKDDGSIDPQQIDHSTLVPLLTAALQEAITKIETLETKVAALEAA